MVTNPPLTLLFGQVGCADDHRHARGEPRKDARELDGDDAAADHHDRARQEGELLDRVRVVHAHMPAQRAVVPLVQHRQPDRARAGREKDALRAQQHLVALGSLLLELNLDCAPAFGTPVVRRGAQRAVTP